MKIIASLLLLFLACTPLSAEIPLVSATGSTHVGIRVAEACAKRAFARGAKRNVAPMTGPDGESLEAFVEQSLRRRALAAAYLFHHGSHAP